jgi:phage gp45-like
MTLKQQINRMLNPIYRCIASMIGRAIIQVVNDTNNLQTVKITLLKDEVKSGVERVQEYGFTSNPPKGSEAILIAPQGSRAQGVIIATDSGQYRVKPLPEGGAALYDKKGNYIKLINDKIEVYGERVDVKSDKVFLGNDTTRGHQKLATEDFVNNVYAMHVHTITSGGSVIYTTDIPTPPIPPVPSKLTGKTKAT